MTRDEQIRILEEAQERAFKQIANTDGRAMGTEEFTRLLGAAHQLSWMAMPHEDSVPEIVSDEVQPEAPKSEIVPDGVRPGAPKSTMTKDELKALLLELSAEHDELDLSDVMGQMGYEKLSDVPADRYDELLRNAKAAAGVEG